MIMGKKYWPLIVVILILCACGGNTDVPRGGDIEDTPESELLISDLNISDEGLKQCIDSLNVSAVSEVNELTCLGVEDLTGISSLTHLRSLSLNGSTKPIAADLSKNTALESLSLLYADLTSLQCPDGGNLRELTIQFTPITLLSIPNAPKLEHISISDSSLTSLNLGGAPNLRTVNITSTPLVYLNLLGNPLLEDLVIENTQLDEVNLISNVSLSMLRLNNSGINQLDIVNQSQLEVLQFVEEQSSLEGLSSQLNITLLDLYGLSNPELDLTEFKYLQHVYVTNSVLEEISLPEDAQIEVLHLENNQVAHLSVPETTQLSAVVLEGNPIDCGDLAQVHKLVPEQTVWSIMRFSNCTGGVITEESYLAGINIPNNALNKCVRSTEATTINELRELTCIGNSFGDTITDLTGLEFLTSLERITLDLFNVEVMDFSAQSNLKSLSISNYTSETHQLITENNLELTELVIRGKSKPFLDLAANIKLESLDMTIGTTDVDITEPHYIIPDNIHLSSLSLSGRTESVDFSSQAGLESLHLSSSLGSVIVPNLSGFTKVQALSIPSAGLKELDISGLKELKSIDLSNNDIEAIDLSNNPLLEVLNLGHNQLRSVDVSQNSNLQFVSLGINQLSSFDSSQLVNLQSLSINSNKIKNFDLGQNSLLQYLQISGNPVLEIDISNNPDLQILSIANTAMDCDQRKTYLQTYPNLDVRYSDNYCSSSE